MRLSDFDFTLPTRLIAQYPLAERTDSRLLDCTGGDLVDREVRQLSQLLHPGDLMIFNDTRVLKARLFATKSSGGAVEVLVERVADEHHFLAMLRASHAPRPGSELALSAEDRITVMDREGELYRFHSALPVLDLLDRYGVVPLPPYITHKPDSSDEARYQTVYAKEPGAVAAPTAGLHFDHTLLRELRAVGVAQEYLTLHVGAGTFLPVRNEDLSLHVMHAERYEIPVSVREAIDRARSGGHRVIAVGTTTLRALESAADGTGNVGMGKASASLFITPGYRFQVADMLLTNFHLPKSTLLILVSAFAGMDLIRRAYEHAVGREYRFFSYGDAMLLERA
jgi:S-adenosylmethionine:tRNA ribosyltransferase-isomerase